LAYAVILGGDDDPPAPTVADVEMAEPAPVVDRKAPDVPAVVPDVSPPRLDVPETEPPEPEPEPEPETTTKLDVPSPEEPARAAPRFPLPRMPGTRKLRASATPAEGGRGWTLVQTLRVPAKLAHVEAFYRKALVDQGMSVSGSSTPARPNRAYLRGRSRRAHADVTITGQEGRLQTTVQTIWRTFR
jgi:hypothetical protein